MDKEKAKVEAEKAAREAKEAADEAKKEKEAEEKAAILSGNLPHILSQMQVFYSKFSYQKSIFILKSKLYIIPSNK